MQTVCHACWALERQSALDDCQQTAEQAAMGFLFQYPKEDGMPRTKGACYLCGDRSESLRLVRAPRVNRQDVAKLACPECARQEKVME